MSVTHTAVTTITGVPMTDEHQQGCPIREVLDRVGDKWSVLIVVLLGIRPHRFSELHRSIDGLSQRMLTLTLRGLERDGLIRRTVYATVPPRVDYALTDLGQTLLVPLLALADWANVHRPDIVAPRAQYDSGRGAVSPGS